MPSLIFCWRRYQVCSGKPFVNQSLWSDSAGHMWLQRGPRPAVCQRRGCSPWSPYWNSCQAGNLRGRGAMFNHIKLAEEGAQVPSIIRCLVLPGTPGEIRSVFYSSATKSHGHAAESPCPWKTGVVTEGDISSWKYKGMLSSSKIFKNRDVIKRTDEYILILPRSYGLKMSFLRVSH